MAEDERGWKMKKRYLCILLNVMRYLEYLIIGMLFVFALLIKAPSLIGIESYRVLSNSMKPYFDQNSIVYVDHRADVDELQKGDVISFKKGDDMIVTHRIVNIKADSFQTKGDANESMDISAVSKEDVVGKVIFVIPGLGLVQQLIVQNIAIVLCSVFILVLTVQYLEKNLKIEEKENDETGNKDEIKESINISDSNS